MNPDIQRFRWRLTQASTHRTPHHEDHHPRRSLTVNLRLEDRVPDAPQPRRQEEEYRLRRPRLPYQQPGQQARVHRRPQHDYDLPADVLHRRTEEQAAEGVHHPETDHHVAELGDAQGARDVRLRELGPDERLLHADVDGEDDQQLLEGLLHLVGGRGEELDWGELVRGVAALLLAVPGTWRGAVRRSRAVLNPNVH